MNNEFPPLGFAAPILAERRKEPARFVPTSPEIIARRGEIAARLREQVAPLAARLRGLSDTERKAVFYKLEHDRPVDLRKLGLKPLAEPGPHFTLAVPRDDLTGFESNLRKFEESPLRYTGDSVRADRAEIASIQTFSEGKPSDRLSQELLDNYAELVARDLVIVEVELLSVVVGAKKQREELQALRTALEQEIAPQGTLFEHEEMRGSCRAVIRCTGAAFQRLVEEPRWQRTISWIEPRPQFQTFQQLVSAFDIGALGSFTSPDDGAPVVCVIDSGVTAGNPFLRPVTRDDLLQSFLRTHPDNPADEFGHGSGVASLVAYYALNIAPGGENVGRAWIASARVLDENNNSDERLFSAALSDVVEFFAPRGVKIFNLSVNVRNRRWNHDARRTMPRRSWIARRLDHLSREHDVLFVVSAGNIIAADVRQSYSDGREYPTYLLDEEFSLLDPAQSALALTVGSIAQETTVVGPARFARALAAQGQASPFTRCGPGITKDIKPEVVDFGGNYVRDEDGGGVRDNVGCSVVMASHQLTPPLKHASGTSMAAARVSHTLALIAQDLATLDVAPSAPLLKAFLVNSCRHPLTEEEMESFVTSLADHPKPWLNVFGYGRPEATRATECDPYSVVLYHQGLLEPDKIAFLDVPVPSSLQDAGNGVKRLTVTVVHSPEVQQWGLEQYLGTVLKWRMFRGDVAREDVVAAMSRAEEGDSPAVPEELPFAIGINRRSRGAVQHDVTQWKQHRAAYSAHHYTLAIAAFSRWDRNIEPVPYAVVVRLEETTRTAATVYSEVRTALIDLQVQQRV